MVGSGPDEPGNEELGVAAVDGAELPGFPVRVLVQPAVDVGGPLLGKHREVAAVQDVSGCGEGER
jgi:hypothetical protein